MTTRKSFGWWLRSLALLVAIASVVVITVAIRRAEPILKARVIETLAARFHGRVELSGFHVSVIQGFQVSGRDLKIFGAEDPNRHLPGVQPLIAIGEFRFGTDLLSLLHTPMRIRRVYLRNLELNIPPREQRQDGGFKRGKIKIYVDEFISEQARLIINTLKAGKLPIEFDISNLRMKDIGPGQPLQFDAMLTNPKPVGAIQATGQFGPWQEDEPAAP